MELKWLCDIINSEQCEIIKTRIWEIIIKIPYLEYIILFFIIPWFFYFIRKIIKYYWDKIISLIDYIKLLFRYYKSSYKVEYKIICRWTNNEADEINDRIKNDLMVLWKINKIYIDESRKVKNKEKIVILEWEISHQLKNNKDKINQWNFRISYKDKEKTIEWKHECHITEEQWFKDINKFKNDFQLFLRYIFMILCIINWDFHVWKNIANQIQDEKNKDKFLYILYKSRTHSANKKDLLEIYNFYKKYPQIKTAQCLPFHLYENWLINESIYIAHKHINIYQGNPLSYTDLAFLYLSEWKELESFNEYNKMSERFDIKVIKDKCDIDKIIDHIDKQKNEKFMLWKYYLSQYLEINPYFEDIKKYIETQNNEVIKNYFLNMIK